MIGAGCSMQKLNYIKSKVFRAGLWDARAPQLWEWTGDDDGREEIGSVCVSVCA